MAYCNCKNRYPPIRCSPLVVSPSLSYNCTSNVHLCHNDSFYVYLVCPALTTLEWLRIIHPRIEKIRKFINSLFLGLSHPIGSVYFCSELICLNYNQRYECTCPSRRDQVTPRLCNRKVDGDGDGGPGGGHDGVGDYNADVSMFLCSCSPVLTLFDWTGCIVFDTTHIHITAHIYRHKRRFTHTHARTYTSPRTYTTPPPYTQHTPGHKLGVVVLGVGAISRSGLTQREQGSTHRPRHRRHPPLHTRTHPPLHTRTPCTLTPTDTLVTQPTLSPSP